MFIYTIKKTFKEQINWDSRNSTGKYERGIISLPFFEFRVHMIIF